MTKTILVTDLREVTKLSILCKCGFSMTLPITARSTPHDECPNCGAKIPTYSLRKMGDELMSLHETLKKFEGMKVTIETEEK